MTTVVEVICIGSELLSGKPNTHVDYFARRLKTAGLLLNRCTTVGDSLADMVEAFKSAIARADIVIAAGGLGPTFDDLTREAVAEATGRKLVFVEDLFTRIKAKFRRARVEMPEENKRQAYIVEGARSLENENGSAPGQILELDGKLIFMLPGPYHEMSPIFERDVLKLLKERFGKDTHQETLALHFAGLPESTVDEALAPVIADTKEPVNFTILGGSGVAHFYATATAPTKAEAKKILAAFRRKLPPKLESHLYSEGDETLETVVGGMLKKRKKTLSTAESCTGGLLAMRITDVAGSSEYFQGGVVTYSNQLKEDLLGVSKATLKKAGAVSKECAMEMAEGARKKFKTDYAIAITGVAGPGGGTKEKPVGLVFIALAGPNGSSKVVQIMGHGDRQRIRAQSATAALDILRKALK